jgi:hypothetical protein
MIIRGEVTKTVCDIVEATCDVTGEKCPEFINCGNQFIDYAILVHGGDYGSKYDMINIDMTLHPDFVYALYLNTLNNKLRAVYESSYGKSRYKITIEEILEI